MLVSVRGPLPAGAQPPGAQAEGGGWWLVLRPWHRAEGRPGCVSCHRKDHRAAWDRGGQLLIVARGPGVVSAANRFTASGVTLGGRCPDSMGVQLEPPLEAPLWYAGSFELKAQLWLRVQEKGDSLPLTTKSWRGPHSGEEVARGASSDPPAWQGRLLVPECLLSLVTPGLPLPPGVTPHAGRPLHPPAPSRLRAAPAGQVSDSRACGLPSIHVRVR